MAMQTVHIIYEHVYACECRVHVKDRLLVPWGPLDMCDTYVHQYNVYTHLYVDMLVCTNNIYRQQHLLLKKHSAHKKKALAAYALASNK